MSRTSILTVAGAVMGSFLSVSAWAFPAAPVNSKTPELILVADGCGPGWHRGPYGHCERNFFPRRVCGPYWHWSPFWGRCVHD